MKSKTTLALFVALGCGILAAVGIVNAIGNDRGLIEEETAPVLVANDFLDIQTALTEENCRIEHWPKKLIPAEAVSDLAAVEGKFNKLRLSKDLPVMLTQIADQAYFGEANIPPGHKVVAIKVKEDDTISGLLKPGQQVDVIGIVDAPKQQNTRARLKIAKTFLKGIRVYSINGKRDGSIESEEQGRRRDAVVGVLVTEKQSEQIVLVQGVGALKLVLRAKTDNLDPEAEPDFNKLFAGIISDADSDSGSSNTGYGYGGDEDDRHGANEPSFVMTIFSGLEPVSHGFNEEGRLTSPEKARPRRSGGSGTTSGGSSSRSGGGSSSRAGSSNAGSSTRAGGSGALSSDDFDGPSEFDDEESPFDNQDAFEEGFEEDVYLGE